MLFFLSALILALSNLTQAQVSQNFLHRQQPVYEFGAGNIILNVPDYPGSGNNRLRVVPFPYYIYRGKYLRADDEGTRARILSSDFHEIGLSFAFNFPVNSGNNPVREGMPNLDAVVGLGPRLLLRILSEPTYRLNFSVSSRFLFSSNFKSRFDSRGVSLLPSLNYWHKRGRLTTFSSFTLEFGSAELNQFFYQVDPLYATATRESYQGKAGLLDAKLSLGFGYNWENDVFLFTSVGYSNLSLSQNRESPLLATVHNVSAILGVVWTFYESDAKVEHIGPGL